MLLFETDCGFDLSGINVRGECCQMGLLSAGQQHAKQ